MLDHVNAVLSVPLTHDDVEGVYAGLRPLLSGESEETSKLSREHVVAHPVPGLVMVAGGKYTTYRVMAKDAVDAVAHGLDGKVPRSCTDRVPLVGGEGYPGAVELPAAAAQASGLHVARIEHLLQPVRLADRRAAGADRERTRPGPAADGRRRLPARRDRLRRHARGRPAPERRADPAHPHLDRDLGPRARRGRGGRRAARAGRSAGTKEQTEREIEYYAKRVEAERVSQEQDADQEADATRSAPPTSSRR